MVSPTISVVDCATDVSVSEPIVSAIVVVVASPIAEVFVLVVVTARVVLDLDFVEAFDTDFPL